MRPLFRIAPYGVVAALCAGLNLVVLIGGDAIGLHYSVSTTLSFMVCVAVGYHLHCRFTFAAMPSLVGLVRYTAAMALNYPLAMVAIWFFRDLLTWPMVVAAPMTTLTLTAYNLLSSRWAVVRPATWSTKESAKQ